MRIFARIGSPYHKSRNRARFVGESRSEVNLTDRIHPSPCTVASFALLAWTPMQQSTGDWALITGANSLIGQQVAIRLGELGYSLALLGFRQHEAMDNLCTILTKLGVDHSARLISLDKQAGLDRVIAWLDDLSIRPTVMAWLAASGVMRPLKDLNMHHLGWTFQVSAFPLAIMGARLAPRKLIVISSTGASRVVDNYGAIGAAKSALETMLRYLAVELAPHTSVYGIRAGLVETSAAHKLPEFDSLRTSVLSRTPMGRLVTPNDIAKLTGVLASEGLEMLTGSIMELDGGMGLVL